MFDENYIQEILKAVGKTTRAEFERMTIRDVRAGYATEVAEAARRLFSSQEQ